jgi:membrane-associated phospholipid phosphatase
MFYRHRFFLIPYFVFLLFGAVIVLNAEKGEFHLFLNQYHFPFANVFFKYITLLGEGIFIIPLIIAVAFNKFRYAAFIAGAFTFSGMLTQFLKKIIFSEMSRPKLYFDRLDAKLYLIEGVTMNMHFSFPSGHATGAFSTFFALALISKNNLLKFLFFIIAFLVAWSRVYLSQHFFVDIYTGSIIAVVLTFVIFHFFKVDKGASNHWSDRSIVKLIRKGKNEHQ